MLRLNRLLLAPEPLLLLISQALFSKAQLNTLVINQSLSLDTTSLPASTFSLPESATSRLFVSVALCDTVPLDTSSNNARFFVTNNSAVNNPGPSSTESDVYEISLGNDGMGNVTLNGGSGGVFSVTTGSTQQRFEVGVSDTAPVHEHLTALPLLGDTTSNQALLFSPPFLPVSFEQPKFPNFTLPDANLTNPDPPSPIPNFTLLIGRTSSFSAFNATTNTFADASPLTACSLLSRSADLVLNTNDNPSNVQSSLVLRDSGGWRTQWLVDGLEPLTNYTAFVFQDNAKVSGPVNFVTKSAFFSCPLVHSLPYCPQISYAVALPPPPPGADSYDSSTLPESISGPLISYMSNFTTSLLTFACGRDWYSSRVGCSDCQTAYRTWLCTVQLPRCGEAASASTSNTDASVNTKRRKRWNFWKRDDSDQAVLASPALVEQDGSEAPRSSSLPPFSSNWTQLLPCLETCNAVERSCPPFLEFKCPVPRFNARESYGVGYIDGDKDDPRGEWIQQGGTVGTAQDRWGNVWCNGPGLTG